MTCRPNSIRAQKVSGVKEDPNLIYCGEISGFVRVGELIREFNDAADAFIRARSVRNFSYSSELTGERLVGRNK